ncbi:arginosuccinate synthase family [Prunus dulcis]|uniref:argininosuccinate synthase n=1 Tax=Prunus dulcis TaxID=3755 RepID=A0A4Y1RIB0_PRUDU|nr:arginosuccinate synthase family [Prunus dulcis]
MAQLKSISAFSSSNLAFHRPKRESFPYHGKVCCPGKLSSFQELGARKSELQGNAFAVSSGNGSVTRAHDKQVIRAVLPSYSETEVSGSTKERGLRGKLNKVVLAYSGGLDTSVIVPWLRENYGCDVVCFTADVGQGLKELEGLEKKAKASGASQLVVKDLKEEFAMVDVAKEVGADAVAHGCTGKGNDQACLATQRLILQQLMYFFFSLVIPTHVRFELTFFALNPKLNVVAPWREWDITGREDAIEYAKKHNGDILEDPENEPKKDMFMLTVDPEDAPNEPEYVDIGIISGIPVSVNGKNLTPASLLDHLNQIGGRHGIGRVDMVENRLVGMKSRGVYETPGGTILFAAARELESLTLDRETMQVKDSLALKYAELVYAGRWFDPLRESMDSFMEEISKTTTGSVTLKLYKGSITVTSRKSPYSLYRQDISSFESGDVYDQADAAGFIRLYGLPIRVRAMLDS